MAALFIFIGAYFVGRVGNAEARILLEAMFPSVRFLCSATMTATATILTLLLTLLSFSVSMDTSFKPSHYQRIQQIALLDSAILIGATLLLLFMTIPISQSLDVETSIYTLLYYGILVYAAVLGGGLVAIILMLFDAVRELTRFAQPKASSALTVDGADSG